MATPALTAEKIEELRALHGRIEVVEGRKPAATAGHPALAPSASMQWVIELPWKRIFGRRSGAVLHTAPSERATSEIEMVAACGSQTSTSFSPPGRFSKRTVFTSLPVRRPV